MNRREPLTEAEKNYIYEQKLSGRRLADIAAELECTYSTARKWWRYRRDGTKPRPRGRPAKGVLSTYPEAVRQKAIALKRACPHRGPAMIRLDLQTALDLDETELPSASRLAALFQEACPEAVQTYRPRQYPETSPTTATQPHQIWQMDGKEKVAIGAKDVATVLNIRDPYSAVMIASQATITTTAKGWRKLTLAEVQNALRDAFHRWGRPLAVQTDREVVYIGAPERYFPSLFTLWLIGLGISHKVSRSRRPTDQGAIEREHRTLGNWLWVDHDYESVLALQAGLDEMNDLYNHRYPARTRHCDREPPLVAHPQAVHSGRSFHPAAEWELFDMARVDRFLAGQVWTRKASETGTVSVAAHPYHLGRSYAGQTVSVTFQPDGRSFRFATEQGDLIDERPAKGLSKADIIGLMPLDPDWPVYPAQSFQLPLPLEGV